MKCQFKKSLTGVLGAIWRQPNLNNTSPKKSPLNPKKGIIEAPQGDNIPLSDPGQLKYKIKILCST